MAGFDPDAYLSGKPSGGFDPDAYLATTSKPNRATASPSKNLKPVSAVDSIVMGLADPVHGGAQLITRILPDGVVQAGNNLNNWLADKTGLVAKIPEGGVDQMVAQREADYQAGRQASNRNMSSLVTGKQEEPGFDWWRTAGNILSPANKAIPMAGPTASLGKQVVSGVTGGAVSSMLTPTSGGDYWEQKKTQALTGGAFGGAAPIVVRGASRLVSPKASTNPQVRKLLDEGITPTPGQLLGGAAKSTEEKLTSLPIVGDAIKSGQTRAVNDLNRTVANRALKPIGESIPEGVSGRDAVDYVETALGKRYDSLLPKLTVKGDSQFATEVNGLSQMVKNGSIDPKYANAFDRYMKTNVLNKFKGQNSLTGQTFKDIESDIGQQATRLAQSNDPDARLLADAYREVQSNMRNMLVRSNPQAAEELKAINTGYANFKRMQRAASGVGAEDGVFSAAQLQSAVKAMDKSKDKAAFARGNALMQDLSDPAKAVLGNTIPNSGTADRSLIALAQLLDPRVAAAAIASPALYSKTGQNALATIFAARPKSAEPIANALRKSSPALSLPAAQVGINLTR